MEGIRTATLDLKRRNPSVPYADTEDDVCISTTHLRILLVVTK